VVEPNPGHRSFLRSFLHGHTLNASFPESCCSPPTGLEFQPSLKCSSKVLFDSRFTRPGGTMTATDQRPPPLVLLLHNHTSVVEIIAYLKDNGLRVANRRNDSDMLAAVLEIDPDLIVLDFAVDGVTVKTLKGDGRTQHIPLIALADVCWLNPGGSA
jgi:CheY-like chemotaxis protein